MTLVAVANCFRARANGLEACGLVVISIPAARGLRLRKPGKYDVATRRKQTSCVNRLLVHKLFWDNRLRCQFQLSSRDPLEPGGGATLTEIGPGNYNLATFRSLHGSKPPDNQESTVAGAGLGRHPGAPHPPQGTGRPPPQDPAVTHRHLASLAQAGDNPTEAGRPPTKVAVLAHRARGEFRPFLESIEVLI